MQKKPALVLQEAFAEYVLWGISGTCVDTKLRGIEATYIVNSNGGWPSLSSYWEQRK